MKTCRFQHISPTKVILILAFAIPFGARAQESRILVGFGGILTKYPQLEGSAPSIGAAAGIQTRLSRSLSLEGAIEYGQFTQEFDAPEGTSSLDLDVWSLDLGVMWEVLRLTKSTVMFSQLGIGLTDFHRRESSVSLGALGDIILPSTNSIEEHLFLEVGVAQKITDQLGLRAGTRFRFLSPFSGAEVAYGIYGGVTIDLF